MLGRDAERAQVEQVLEEVASAPAGIAIEGAPGIGKTTVWHTAVDSARRRGYLVLEAAPSEPDLALAFAGLGDLLDRVPQEIVRTLSDSQRRALDAAVFLDEPGDPPLDPEALPRAILSMLRRLSAEQPLVVAIDDEQWLDRPSARVLGFALRRLRDERVGVVLTRRSDSDGALWPQLAPGFGRSVMSKAILDQLDQSTFDRLLESRLRGTISRPLLRRIQESSGGNPFYALAIADQLEAGGLEAMSDRVLPLPRSLADALRGRLEHVGPRARDPLFVVASVSRPTLALLQAVIPGFALSDLDSAQAAGIIELADGEVRFTHPLLASAHQESVPPVRRRELHRALAAIVQAEEERARHLALGAEAPDHQIASALEQAAQDAGRRGAPEVAADFLEDAARLTPFDALETRQGRIIEAAEQRFAAGQQTRARFLLEGLVAEIPRGPIRARALAQLGWIRNDDFELGTALLQEALTEAGDDYRLRAEIESLLAEVHTNLGDFAGQLRHAIFAVENAERAADPGMLARALSDHAMAKFFNGLGVDRALFDRAIELEGFLEGSITWMLPSTPLAGALGLSDDLAAAMPIHRRGVQRALDRREEGDLGLLLWAAALFEWEAGNLAAAEQYAAQCAEVARQQVNPELDSWVAFQEGQFAAQRGRLEQAWAATNRSHDLATSSGNVLFIAVTTILLASLELWKGNPDLAHDRLNPFRDRMLERGFRYLGETTLPMWSTDIEALIALGRLDEAEPVLADLRDRASRSDNPNAVATAHRCHGQLLAARGEVVAGIEAIDAALDAHAERPVPLALGRTLLEKGALERRARRKSAAKQTLEEALTILERLEARLWIERARDELSRIGLRRARVTEGLTPAQTRVAELVAAGLTNQEIASTLYMSTRSVESHLTKIYRDFGVRSRGQLMAAFAARRGDAADESGPKEKTSDGQEILPGLVGAAVGGVVGADSLWVEPSKDG